MKVRTRDGDFDWGFGKRLFAQLALLSGVRKTFKGMVLQLTRIGSGLETQWSLAELTEETPPPPPTRQQEARAEKVEIPARVEELVAEVKLMEQAIKLVSFDAAAGVTQS